MFLLFTVIGAAAPGPEASRDFAMVAWVTLCALLLVLFGAVAAITLHRASKRWAAKRTSDRRGMTAPGVDPWSESGQRFGRVEPPVRPSVRREDDDDDDVRGDDSDHAGPATR